MMMMMMLMHNSKMKSGLDVLALNGSCWQRKQSIRSFVAIFAADVPLFTKLTKVRFISSLFWVFICLFRHLFLNLM
jgi:hypothetical protein